MGQWFRYIALMITMVALQVLVFSHVNLYGMLNAFPYVYLLLVLPFAMSGPMVLITSALLGFLVDFYSGTPGVHTAAIVLAAYVRILLLPAIAPQGDYEVGTSPSVRENGWGWFMRYAAILVFVHHFALFFIESFSFAHFGATLVSIITTSIFTLLMVVLFQYATRQKMS